MHYNVYVDQYARKLFFDYSPSGFPNIIFYSPTEI